MQTARLILFDLDGTLIDSAPDLAGATNEMLVARGRPALPLALLRPHVGSGARGMLGAAFGCKPGDAEFEALKSEWFERYEPRMLRETRLFEGVAPVLDALLADGLSLGIVTNKAERYAIPVCEGLGLAAKSHVIIGGDSTPHRKPHPAPVLEAARRAGIESSVCVFVGDDERDVLAGRAAGMATVAVRWGYVDAGKPISQWGADHVIDAPHELVRALAKN
ncbi:MAG: phosphoglycolate phosphatase [Paucibacter sp.]|nr:phosphoglycolate phosphatase [Roseateles sp.]